MADKETRKKKQELLLVKVVNKANGEVVENVDVIVAYNGKDANDALAAMSKDRNLINVSFDS
jgi:uncharacterized GH25 family protein